MKTFRVALWTNDRKQPGTSQPDARGLIDIPAAVVQELYAYLQAGQGMKPNQQGEQCFQLRVSAWRGVGGNAPVISGQIESMSEAVAYQQRQIAPANGNGADFLAPAPQSAAAAAPVPLPPAAAPVAQPAPAAAPVAAPAPGGQWAVAPQPSGGSWGSQPPAF